MKYKAQEDSIKQSLHKLWIKNCDIPNYRKLLKKEVIDDVVDQYNKKYADSSFKTEKVLKYFKK